MYEVEGNREGESRENMSGRGELGVNEAAVYVAHVVASAGTVKYEGSVTYHPLPAHDIATTRFQCR